MGIKVKKGKILVYRVFDIGSEIDLEKVEKLLEDKKTKERFKLDRKHNMSLFISMTPVAIQLGSVEMKLQDKKIQAELTAKVWHFGSASLCFQIPIEDGTSWDELIKISNWLENDDEVDVLAKAKILDFQQEISPAIPVLAEIIINEDYVTYFIQEVEGLSEPIIKHLSTQWMI